MCQGKSPAVRVEEPVSSTCCSLWNSSRAGMSGGDSGLCYFSFFKHTTMPPWFFKPGTLLLLVRSSLLLYLLCNSFSRKPLAEEECSGHRPLCGLSKVRASSLGLCSLSGCLSPFPAVPLVCNLPAFILSAYMYKM